MTLHLFFILWASTGIPAGVLQYFLIRGCDREHDVGLSFGLAAGAIVAFVPVVGVIVALQGLYVVLENNWRYSRSSYRA